MSEELADGLSVERDEESGRFTASQLDPNRAREIGRLGGRTLAKESQQRKAELVGAFQALLDESALSVSEKLAGKAWIDAVGTMAVSGRGGATRAAELLAPFVPQIAASLAASRARRPDEEQQAEVAFYLSPASASQIGDAIAGRLRPSVCDNCGHVQHSRGRAGQIDQEPPPIKTNHN